MKTISLILSLSLVCIMITKSLAQNESQSELPYYKIPDYPEKYTAGTVAARMVDGLGFRYYWATEGLREQDLVYRPNEDARSILETLDHIYGLSLVIVNATTKKPNVARDEKELSFEEYRERTLMNIEKAANILRTCSDQQFDEFKIVFETTGGTSEFPFWNNLNGPIEDAVWHCGQVVSLRRSAGNPFNSNVSLLRGRLMK